jgi:hypothetical protein
VGNARPTSAPRTRSTVGVGLMTYDEIVFEALAYHRNFGVRLGDIRGYAVAREAEKHTAKDDRAALRRLQEAGKVVQVGERWFLTPEGFKQVKGTARDAQWQLEDAWILSALLSIRNPQGQGSRLEHIIAVADYINHGIPTLEEMHGSLNRLDAGRLLKVGKGTFFTTEKSRGLWTKVQATCKRTVMAQLDGLLRILKCPCCGVRLKSVRWRIPLDQATWDDAYAKYHKPIAGK